MGGVAAAVCTMGMRRGLGAARECYCCAALHQVPHFCSLRRLSCDAGDQAPAQPKLCQCRRTAASNNGRQARDQSVGSQPQVVDGTSTGAGTGAAAGSLRGGRQTPPAASVMTLTRCSSSSCIMGLPLCSVIQIVIQIGVVHTEQPVMRRLTSARALLLVQPESPPLPRCHQQCRCSCACH